MHLHAGDVVYLTEAPDGLRVTPYDPNFARQMENAERIMKKRRAVLRSSRNRFDWLDEDVVLAIHEAQVAEHGGRPAFVIWAYSRPASLVRKTRRHIRRSMFRKQQRFTLSASSRTTRLAMVISVSEQSCLKRSYNFTATNSSSPIVSCLK